MRLRTFTAPSMSAALRLVRAEMGPDAVILSTEKSPRAVRLTAALEYAGPLQPIQPLTRIGNASQSSIDSVIASLKANGTPVSLASRIAAIVKGLGAENSRMALNAALRSQFAFQSIVKNPPNKPIILVGLPGAGKTSCAAKLAAMARTLERKPIMITCDLAKAGAVEQMSVYAHALGVTAYRAKDPAALRKAVGRAENTDTIIIDTSGANPFSVPERNAMRELAIAAGAEPVLVQACGGDSVEAIELAQCYAEAGAKRIIATRLDASKRVGSILAAADGAKMFLADFSSSPQIAAVLRPMDAGFLADRILSVQPHHSPRDTSAGIGSHP